MELSPDFIIRKMIIRCDAKSIVINIRLYYTDDTVYAEAVFTYNDKNYVCSNQSAKRLAVSQAHEITGVKVDDIESTVHVETDKDSYLFVSWR